MRRGHMRSAKSPSERAKIVALAISEMNSQERPLIASPWVQDKAS